VVEHEIMRSPYCAGSVRRYHTWPVNREQTVADHSFHVLRLYWTLFGSVPPEVTEYIIWHDMGELWTGDSPYPLKRNNPELKDKLDLIEMEGVLAMGGAVSDLTTDQKKRIKVCDYVEMLEYALHEVNLGNQYAMVVLWRIWSVLCDILPHASTLEMTQSGRRYFDRLTERVNELK